MSNLKNCDDRWKKDEIKTLPEILNEGINWQNGLSTIITDLCKRVIALEKK